MPPEGSTSRDASPSGNPCWQMPGDATEPAAPSSRSFQSLRNNQSPGRAQVSHACLTAVSGTFDSLSKVLCIFPSRYFYATGLEYVWGIKWSIPPNWRSHFRERDSVSTCRAHTSQRPDGILTLHNPQCQRSWIYEYAGNMLHQIVEAQASAYKYVALSIRSPLLRESHSFPFPPLIYMLKFSG